MPKPGSALVQDALDELLHSRYDAIKAHEYYIRTRKLKGRKKGSQGPAKVIPISSKRRPSAHKSHSVPPALQVKVHHLEARLDELRSHLQKLLANKSKSSSKSHHETAASKTKKAVSDKKYRQTHKAELARKRKAKSKSSHGGSGGGGGSSSKSISSMTETELRAAIKKTSANLHAAVAKARAAANRGTA